MHTLRDIHGRMLRLTEERLHHVRVAHPELRDPLSSLKSTLRAPARIVRSRTDDQVELFYRYFDTTPVTSKYLCVVVKMTDDPFIITFYFTDTIKGGTVLWTET